MIALLALLAALILPCLANAQAPSATLSVTVTPASKPGTAAVTVNGKTSGAAIPASSQFSVGWSGAPGGPENWIGICPASGAAYPPNCDATQHYWVSLACYPWHPDPSLRPSGSCGEMVTPATPGNYVISLYDGGGPNYGNASTTVNGGYGVVLGSAPFSVTALPPPSGSNYGGYLLGGDWDQTAGWATVGIPKQIWGCGNVDCAPQPMHYALPFIRNQSDAAAAASDPHFNDSYIAGYQAAFPYTYQVRICNEWQGNGQCGPFIRADENAGEAIDPATWIKGVRNFVAALRANPKFKNVKTAIDAPYTAEQAKYWPGDDVIDVITYDIYTGNGTGGPGSVHSWQYVLNNYLTPMLARNKPMAIPEFCDKFPDGYFIEQMANWMNTHKVVMLAWWNAPGWGGSVYGEVNCQFDATTDKLAAYQHAFGNNKYKYTGSFWPVIIPWP